MQLAGLFTVAAIAAQTVIANGINCRGSPVCGFAVLNGAHLNHLKSITDKIQDNRIYRNGERAACIRVNTVNLARAHGTVDICAYPKNSGGNISGSTIKNLMQHLVDEKCGLCGSVPLGYDKGDNDGSHGELTINVVGGIPVGCMADTPCPPN